MWMCDEEEERMRFRLACVCAAGQTWGFRHQESSDGESPDAVKGTPAGSVALKAFQRTADGGWTQIATGVTDGAGEVHELITEQQFPAGVYRVDFDTKTYWKNEGSAPFHEVADVVFEAHAEGHRHYTLALLLSPYSYTTTAVAVDAHQ